MEMFGIPNILPTRESHVRELLKLESDAQRTLQCNTVQHQSAQGAHGSSLSFGLRV